MKPTTRPSCDRHPHQSVVVAAVPHLACLEPSMQRALLFLVPAALVMAWQPMSSSILTHSLGHCPLVHPVPYLFLVQLTVSSRWTRDRKRADDMMGKKGREPKSRLPTLAYPCKSARWSFMQIGPDWLSAKYVVQKFHPPLLQAAHIGPIPKAIHCRG